MNNMKLLGRFFKKVGFIWCQVESGLTASTPSTLTRSSWSSREASMTSSSPTLRESGAKASWRRFSLFKQD